MFLSRRFIQKGIQVFPKYFCTENKPPVIKGDYYELLGVAKDANKEIIIQKYKDLGNVYSILLSLNNISS